MENLTYSIDEIDCVAQNLIQQLSGINIVTLTGSLGAGKTTIVGAMLRAWGVLEPITSPTFTYINMYQTKSGMNVYHFDLYRLKNIQEFEQAGFFEYLYQPNSVALIEWPEIIIPALQGDMCCMQLLVVDTKKRELQYQIIKNIH